MKKSTNQKFGLRKYLSGKGFYVALGLCLAGAAAASWMAVNSTLSEINRQNQSVLDSTQGSTAATSQSAGVSWNFPSTEDVDVGEPVTDIPISTVASSSASSAPKQEYSSAASSNPPAQSERQVASVVPPPQDYVLPVESQIFNPYSKGELVKNVTLNDWRTHNGIDFAAPEQTPVVAVADGVVTSVHYDQLWGNVVEIAHSGNITSYYCGLMEEVAVKAGEDVKMEQVIGYVGGIPCESALPSHLHFEIKVDGAYGDPLAVMGKVRPEDGADIDVSSDNPDIPVE